MGRMKPRSCDNQALGILLLPHSNSRVQAEAIKVSQITKSSRMSKSAPVAVLASLCVTYLFVF